MQSSNSQRGKQILYIYKKMGRQARVGRGGEYTAVYVFM